MRLILLALPLVLFLYPISAQSKTELLEEQQSQSTFEIDHTDIQETALLYKYSIKDLNTITREQLESIGVLSQLQINDFVNHKLKYGKFLSIYELKTIPSFDDATLEQFLPFVNVVEAGINGSALSIYQNLLDEDNHFLVGRFERTVQKQRGYTATATPSTRYLGNPYKYYLRYKIAHINNFSIGFTMEKDPGEQFLWSRAKRQYGFDHLVAHLQLQKKGIIQNLIVGNFTMSAGQGLVFANGYYIAKSAETVLYTKRNQLGLMPFNSLLESSYFKGIGVTLQHKKTAATVFLSERKIDSNIQTDTNRSDESFINSIYTTGLHRTAREFNNKNAIGQVDVGYNIRFTHKRFNIGHSSVFTQFYSSENYRKLDLVPKKYTYNSNAFKGSSNYVNGVDFNYYYKNINIFGEFAHQQTKGRGLVLGSQMAIGQKVDFAVVYRNFNPFFNSFYANAFSEYFGNNDERGLYMGLKLSPHRKWTLTAYYDHFSNKQLKYRQYSPGEGSEHLLSITYKAHRKVSVYAQYRSENKLRNFSESTATYKVLPAQRNVSMVALRYDLEKRISFHTKIYKSLYNHTSKRTGVVLSQDLIYKAPKFSISGRYALFDTDDYDTRIYIYEKDVMYSFSFPAYQGKGIRYYLILQYNIRDRLRIWLRWSHTQYIDRQTVGVAGEMIQGNETSELKVQIKWMLNKR